MKKKLSMILATAIVSSLLTLPVRAEATNATVTRSSNTITASLTVDNAVSYEYQWVERTTADGEYVELPTDTNSTYDISPRDKNKYINCEITPVFSDGSRGEAVYGASDVQITSLGKQSRSNTFPNKTTPSDYTFVVNGYGRQYVLLDWFHDKKDTFFVMMDDTYWQGVFDSTEGHTKYEPDCETNIGYQFNSETFKKTGLAEKWPTVGVFDLKLVDYINWDHEWWTEQGWDGSTAMTADYSFTAGIAPLSITEAWKYRERFGTDPKGNNSWYWTRSTRGNDGGAKNQVQVMKNSAKQIWPAVSHTPIPDGAGYVTPYVRIAFHLNEDFFKNVKINILNDNGDVVVGSFVRDMLVKKYSVEELMNLYTDEELEAIGFEIPNRPTITKSGGTNGSVVKLTAALEDENAVSYHYQWVERTTENGVYTDIRGDKSQVYVVSTLDKNKYLNCRVTPVYADGSLGNSAMAASDYYVENLGQYTRSAKGSYPFPVNTPVENSFKISGQGRSYILLDEFTDTESAFYVMDDFLYGGKMFDTNGSAKYDPTSETNIAYALNSETFKTSGLNGTTLNQGIADHINWNHVWWTEAGLASGATQGKDYSFTGGIGLLSLTEAYKYCGKFGYRAGGATNWWWTRTQRAIGSTDPSNILTMKNAQEFWDVNGKTGAEGVTPGIRTTYFLDEDFFREVKLYDIGDNVKEIILNRYDKSELAGLYDESELAEIGYPASISIEDKPGNLYTPNELVLNVDYTSAFGDYIEIIVSCNGNDEYYFEDFGTEGEAIIQDIVLENIPYGTQELVISVQEGGEEMASLNKTVYVVPETQSDYGQAGTGINITWSTLSGNVEEYIDNVKKLGFNDLRVEFTWDGRTESVEGEYNTDYFKKVMDVAKDNEMSVTALLAYNNSLYSSNTKGAIDTAEERTAFVNYAKAIVKAYPEIKKVEIWNEPNNTTFWDNETSAIGDADIANYTLLVKEVSTALKEISSDINVYAGAIDVSKEPIEYIEVMLENGAYEYMDTLSYHPYFHPNNITSGFINNRITNYKETLRNAGGFKALAATEFGFSTDLFENADEENQKREVPKGIVALAANNIDSVNVFNYKDSNEAFGLLKADGTPRPLMYSMAQLNHALNGTIFVGKLPTDTGVTAYVFYKDSKPMIVAWSFDNSTFEVNGANAKAYDVYGNAISGSTLTLGLDPVYIENVSKDYIKSAYDNEVAIRKAAISDYFVDLDIDILDAIENDENVKALVKASEDLTDAEKAAVLDMYYEVEVVKATYNAINDSSDVTIPTARYTTLKVSANDKYSKAALKYAYRYIEEAKVEDAPVVMVSKNVKIANALLDSVEALSNNEVTQVIEISNVAKADGVLTFDVTNTTGKDLTVYVATYTQDRLVNIAEVDLSDISVNIGENSGKIFVWQQNTMIPLIDATDF